MNKTFAWILAIILVALGIWYFAGRTPALEPAPAATNDGGAATTTAETPAVPQATTVTYTDAGFSPNTVTVKVGETVTWVNQSSGKMWVASAMHPSHAVYDGSATAEHCASGAPKTDQVFDQCTATASSTSWSFTFTKAGTWKYHNHVNAGDFGSVVVTADTGVSASATLDASL